MSGKPIFTSPQDVETAFYDAIERADLEALMALWAEDEEIVCVHPGSPRYLGYQAIREAWKRVLEGNLRMRLRVVEQTRIQGPFSAIHTVIEHISVQGNESTHAPVIATNVYVRGPLGWRLAVHHASPAPPGSSEETPKTLH
jgi:uncharacterized protein (TIGR02246 family)